MILKGAQGQGSPSPLDYVFCKALDDIKGAVHSFGLKDAIYYRLFSNIVKSIVL